MIDHAHLRIARATDNLSKVVSFYRDGLGFEVVGSFEDHDGFDGIMLGHHALGYHLEFTHQRDHLAGVAPTKENLLVFYLPNKDDWDAAVDRMVANGHNPIKSANPYWDVRGKTFEDPDGYRVVLQNAQWPEISS